MPQAADLRPDRSAPQRLAPVIHGARTGLTMYWRGAVMTVGASGAALAAFLVAARLMTRHGPPLSLVTARGGYLGLQWNWFGTTTPMTLQHDALQGLFTVLLAVASGVAIVAVVTVLTIAATRAAQRIPEIGVRRAVGASRRHLLAAAFGEGIFLFLVAAAIGLPPGLWLAHRALVAWPGTTFPPSTVAVVWTSVTLAAILVIGSLLTLIPARTRAVRERSAKSPAIPAAAFQLGLSVIVLTLSAMLGRRVTQSESRAVTDSTGIVLQIDSPAAPAARARQYTAIVDSLARTPGLDLVSLASPGALTGIGVNGLVVAECGECTHGFMQARWQVVPAVYHFVTPDTFKAIGARLVGGRLITLADDSAATPVAVVDHDFATRHFAGGNPLGRHVKLGTDSTLFTVVGVVDAPTPTAIGVNTQPRNVIYLSALQRAPSSVDLLIRGDGARHAAATARTLLNGEGIDDHHVRMLSFGALLAAEWTPLAWLARWIGFEGWMALLIAAAGVWSLMRLWIGSLLPEIGIRRAIGATRHRVIGWVMVRALLVPAWGVAVALWFTPGAHDMLAASLQGVPAWTPGPLLRFAALLTAIALAAALVPAWRANRTPPAHLVDSAEG